MPIRHYSNSEAKVGLFLAFCLGLLVVMLVIYGHFSPLWMGYQEINVTFVDAGALKPNASVRYNGFEIGRVKRLRMLHLDDEQLDRLAPCLTKQNLDNLPLHSETLRKELRTAEDADFVPRCRAALKNRTMIELSLEVLQEGDAQRYRLDDQIRIVSTIFGDTAVEIISGHGSINSSGGRRLLLGTSGDFFSNLAKSMNEVKNILSNVTEVVGTEERRSFARNQGRLAGISGRLDKIATLANSRAGETGKKFDSLSGQFTKVLERAGNSLDNVPSQTEHTAENVKAGLKMFQQRLDEVRSEAGRARDELAADFKPIRDQVNQTLEKSKPDLEEMRTKIRNVYDKMGGLSGAIENLRETAGRELAQSEPDLERTRVALKNGLLYLTQMGQAALENKDRMISEKDNGEHEYATAVCIYRGLCLAARRIREAAAEAGNEARVEAEDETGAAVASRAQAASGKLLELYGKLAAVRDAVETKMLPEFERKRAFGNEKTLPVK